MPELLPGQTAHQVVRSTNLDRPCDLKTLGLDQHRATADAIEFSILEQWRLDGDPG